VANPYVFREYDIRGVAAEDFPDEMVSDLGKALGTYFLKHEAHRITLGRDCRLTSPRLHENLSEGILKTGCSIIDLGIIPTPLLYFSLFHLDLSGAIMITGSHNPPDNNGFKICLNKITIYGEEIQTIRSILETGEFEEGKGQLSSTDITAPYLETVSALLAMGSRRRKAVIDAGNGTAGIVAGAFYRKLGAEVVELFCEMDGSFPHHHPDPTIPANLKALIAAVKEQKADLGIAYDGDGDRIGVVAENGSIIWGDQLMIVFSRAILDEVPGATFIAEVKCSQTLFDAIAEKGGTAIMGKVGHSPMKARLKEENAQLAGEVSGHIFFANRYYGYDDAIYAGARLLEILSRTEKNLSELLDDVPPTVTTPEIRIACADAIKFMVVQKLVESFKRDYHVIDVDGARVLFEGGWGLVRASNTQPVLVLRFEARDAKTLQRIRTTVEKAVASCVAAVKRITDS